VKYPPLPRKVKGSISDYKVTRKTVDHTNAGECVITEGGCELRITRAVDPGNQWQTFIHELIHKWEHEGVVTPLRDVPGDSDVDRLAFAILSDFLRNNWTLPGA